MTMADPWEGTGGTLTLELELQPTDPADELTCLFCWGPKVQYETTLRLGGRTLTVGIHASCANRLQAKSKPSP
jgi:hypothetical protein